MAQSVERRCDQCGSIMPGRFYEMRFLLVVHNGQRRELFVTMEVCSAACYTTASNALMREGFAGEAADCHSIGARVTP